MENAEEIQLVLERYSRLKPKEIPEELEEYLTFVAKTGDTVFKWPLIQHLFREKLMNVITEFHDTTPSISDNIPHYPNVDPFNFEIMKKMLIERMESFPSAPFTVQRICELLTEPRKQYSRIDKFLRAIEKNILVVSTLEPGRRRHESENGESMDSTMNGDLSGEGHVDVGGDEEHNDVVLRSNAEMNINVDEVHKENDDLHLENSDEIEIPLEKLEPEVNVMTVDPLATDEPESKTVEDNSNEIIAVVTEPTVTIQEPSENEEATKIEITEKIPPPHDTILESESSPEIAPKENEEAVTDTKTDETQVEDIEEDKEVSPKTQIIEQVEFEKEGIDEKNSQDPTEAERALIKRSADETDTQIDASDHEMNTKKVKVNDGEVLDQPNTATEQITETPLEEISVQESLETEKQSLIDIPPIITTIPTNDEPIQSVVFLSSGTDIEKEETTQEHIDAQLESSVMTSPASAVTETVVENLPLPPVETIVSESNIVMEPIVEDPIPVVAEDDNMKVDAPPTMVNPENKMQTDEVDETTTNAMDVDECSADLMDQ